MFNDCLKVLVATKSALFEVQSILRGKLFCPLLQGVECTEARPSAAVHLLQRHRQKLSRYATPYLPLYRPILLCRLRHTSGPRLLLPHPSRPGHFVNWAASQQRQSQCFPQPLFYPLRLFYLSLVLFSASDRPCFPPLLSRRPPFDWASHTAPYCTNAFF